MSVIEHYDCPTCVGTGSMESSDSTDDRWWDCTRCKGTGKLEDRRRPDHRLAGAVAALRTYGQHATDCASLDASGRYSCDCGWADALDHLGGQKR